MRWVLGWADERARSFLFDLLVSLFVVTLALTSVPRTMTGPVRAIGFGMAMALLVRRRFPLSTMAVVSLLALQQVLWFPPADDPVPYDAAVLIAMYSVVKYGRWLSDAVLAAVPVAIGIVFEVVRHPQRDQLYVIALYLALCGGTWLGGLAVRTRRQYVAGLEERAATAERERDHLARIAVAEERAAIARELHDVVAHSLAVMIVQADGASYALDAEPAQARAAIKQVGATGREALEDMRRLVGVLRGAGDAPPDADEHRRITLEQLVERARSAGLPIAVEVQGERTGVPPAVELTLYRLVQESLTNVLRHAGQGATGRLTVRYAPTSVEMEMADDGSGAIAPTPDRPDGHGLIGMRERVAVHGGEFEAGPVLGGGWRVRATIPLGAG
ncbi:sensor histidine kinase [Actinoplanes subtropicus]|uniref:sensor histidine kinase n=1 Tax=Actinoplanes subtropicus TaxID=543632 RepID=UPI00068DA388|nr:sensor histidine kinase [Actinoplanes subtropicus]